jgi:predicted RNA-binding Zn ribbon-like protein
LHVGSSICPNVQLTAHRFAPHDLVSGHACLDLVNTVTARDSSPHDWLINHSAFLQWTALTGRFSQGDLAKLGRQAAQNPIAAQRSLHRCKRLREVLHRLFAGYIAARAPLKTDLAELDQFRIAAHSRLQGRALAGRVHFQPTLVVAGLELITDTLVLQALEVLRDPPDSRLRVCAGCECGWLFHDRSRGGQRRWCDMATCGSGEKTRRFRGKDTISHAPQ